MYATLLIIGNKLLHLYMQEEIRKVQIEIKKIILQLKEAELKLIKLQIEGLEAKK